MIMMRSQSNHLFDSVIVADNDVVVVFFLMLLLFSGKYTYRVECLWSLWCGAILVSNTFIVQLGVGLS